MKPGERSCSILTTITIPWDEAEEQRGSPRTFAAPGSQLAGCFFPFVIAVVCLASAACFPCGLG